MKLRIVNETGRGMDTEVYLIDGDREMSLLQAYITRIDFKPIKGDGTIEAALHFMVDEFDVITDINQETLNRLHEEHNAGMLAAMGLPRI